MPNILLKLPDDLHAAAKAEAKKQDRSLSSLIRRAIQLAIDFGNAANEVIK